MNFDTTPWTHTEYDDALNPFTLPSGAGEAVSLTRGGEVVKRIVRAGRGELPASTAVVRVRYTARTRGGAVFNTSDELDDSGSGLEFSLRTGAVVVGLELVVRSMRPGEVAEATCAASFGYGDVGKPPEVGPGAELEFHVELLSWREREPQPWELSASANLSRAQQLRGCGNEHVKAGAYAEAAMEYHKALMHAAAAAEAEPPASPLNASPAIHPAPTPGVGAAGATTATCADGVAEEMGEDGDGLRGGAPSPHPLPAPAQPPVSSSQALGQASSDETTRLQVACRLNLALCQLKVGDHALALESCAAVLEQEPGNPKALYRRGLAAMRLGDLEGAKVDLLRAREAQPGNRSVTAALAELRERAAGQRAAERQLYKSMLGGGGGGGGGNGGPGPKAPRGAVAATTTAVTAPAASNAGVRSRAQAGGARREATVVLGSLAAGQVARPNVGDGEPGDSFGLRRCLRGLPCGRCVHGCARVAVRACNPLWWMRLYWRLGWRLASLVVPDLVSRLPLASSPQRTATPPLVAHEAAR